MSHNELVHWSERNIKTNFQKFPLKLLGNYLCFSRDWLAYDVDTMNAIFSAPTQFSCMVVLDY